MEGTWASRPFAGCSGLGELASEQKDQCLNKCIQRMDVTFAVRCCAQQTADGNPLGV